jgi:hypothetical protein
MILRIGMYVWGGVTILMAVACSVFILYAGLHLGPHGNFSLGAPEFMPGMYIALKDNGSIVAAILAASGLAWSYFFNVLPPLDHEHPLHFAYNARASLV